MIRGQYIAATGMMTQQKRMEVITNNLVNVETTGFKKDQLISVSFDDVLIQRINDANVVSQRQEVGPLNFGVHVDYIDTDYTQGALETTEISTHLAIIGDAFFVVELEDGTEAYTRSGNFSVDPDGYLVTADGHYVQGSGGPILVGTPDFSVNEEGVIMADGAVVDTIRLVTFDDNAELRKIGGNLYTTEAETLDATDYALRQGMLEGSNVDTAREMVDMMMVYRLYETNQRILSMIDETVGKAVTEIGRLR